MLKAKVLSGRYKHFNDLDIYDKAQVLLSYGMRLVMLVLIVAAAITRDWLELFLIFGFFVLTFVPSVIERSYKITLPLELDFLIMAFVFLGLVLGDIKGAYAFFPWWDNLLHFVSGIVIGLFGFAVVWLLVRYSHNSKLDSWLAVLFSFSFAMMVGTVWEFFEFGITISGIYTMQHGLYDTMMDLIFDALGALVATFFGWLYVTERRRVAFIHRILHKCVSKKK